MLSPLLLGALPALAGCGSDDEGGTSSGKAFGECCSSDSQCGSDACSPYHKACSLRCESDSDCPPEPKTGEPSCKNGFCQAEYKDDRCGV